MNENLVILYSGGLESRFLVDLSLRLKYTPLCLLVDYGQKHLAELKKAEEVCNRLCVTYTIAEVSLPMVRSRLVGQSEGAYSNVSEWYVPARNSILVTIAASVAESQGIDTIWIGASYTDRINHFPDCTQEWIVAMNEMLFVGLSRKVQVVAPLLGWPKELVRSAAKQAFITEEEIYSGYGE